jgi:hypothetical protein
MTFAERKAARRNGRGVWLGNGFQNTTGGNEHGAKYKRRKTRWFSLYRRPKPGEPVDTLKVDFNPWD